MRKVSGACARAAPGNVPAIAAATVENSRRRREIELIWDAFIVRGAARSVCSGIEPRMVQKNARGGLSSRRLECRVFTVDNVCVAIRQHDERTLHEIGIAD